MSRNFFNSIARCRPWYSLITPDAWSEQSWDEMFNGFYDVSIDKLERRGETFSTASAASRR